ncbi:HlyD family type I secretion periplasmic adaptor subunit [Rhizobium sp. L1K21]|uniref:HlyD family type I secretion periplasmic adaptor subunit n=1 Tax=Rhizobium sp. L1K21 TaxID=2954933 RepID=UPI0020927BA9|nr:HlyD family type I secretion periplasmic adaptor subunit [Rhizobium sp. L1K21]MCO6187922.1 HlyD family type I secretion periplasmic adaptor subunit [Rhizobium sp. L1K21]
MSASELNEADPLAAVETSVRGVTGLSGKFILFALAIMLAWAFLVPLGSAVIAPATLASSGHNQQLQHVRGGMVTGIFAKEGDLVPEGSVVVTLDPAIDQANLTRLQARHAVLEALRTRLEAEKAGGLAEADLDLAGINVTAFALRGSQALDFNTTASIAETTIAKALNAEQGRQYEKGRLAIGAQLRGLSDRAEGQRQRLASLTTQIENAKRRTELLENQLSDAQTLAKAGHISRNQVWEIETRLLDSQSSLTDLHSQLTSTQSLIGETEAEMDRVRMADGMETSRTLTDVLAELEQISDELTAAESAMDNAALRAPVRGYLVRLSAKTLGGVVKPGDVVGEIVPADAPLEVKARVALDKISAVRMGQSAELKLSTLNPRVHEPINATITYVAADASQDDATGERFFEVHAKLDETTTQNLEVALLPGMSGELFIEGETRTFATYMLQPLLDGLARTFREVH